MGKGQEGWQTRFVIDLMARKPLTGINVLQTLVSNSGMRWTDLCDEFADDHDERDHFMALVYCLESLAEADLISEDGVAKEDIADFLYTECLLEEEAENATIPFIRGSSSWRKTDFALHHDFRRNPSGRPQEESFQLTIFPWFGMPRQIEKSMDVFIAAPFSAQFDAIALTHVTPSITALGWTCGGVRDVFASTSIMGDIWTLIINSKLVVADCTGRNPNVFYEMGIAHTLGRPVILLTQVPDDVPFDLRHLRYILYEYTPPGMKVFETQLSSAVKETIGWKRGA
jgi:hypothetical protein